MLTKFMCLKKRNKSERVSCFCDGQRVAYIFIKGDKHARFKFGKGG
jgi:hypothetical protein